MLILYHLKWMAPLKVGQETINQNQGSAGTDLGDRHYLTGWTSSGNESQQNTMQQPNLSSK